ncbi:MAG: hypothetical protein Q8938_02540 [Bacteroidota bacterium]|nr:hypothetical protein [Bacteroidota bacterium]
MQGTEFIRFRRWAVLCLLNFVLVSVLGMLLRIKIALPLPGVNYKYLLHAHSHFAFAGWISTALFTALLYVLSLSGFPIRRVYTYQFWLAQTASYGMLLSFPFEGYGPVSIIFSMLSLIFSWWFSWQFGKDVGRSGLPPSIKRWIRAALFFFVLSGAGPLLLAYIMTHKMVPPTLSFNSVYLFLHFQYNGWFSFAVLALFFFTAKYYQLPWDEKKGRIFFGLMAIACIPAYCLSLLWMDPPAWVFVIAAAAAGLQMAALLFFLSLLRDSWAHWSRLLPYQTKLFWGLSCLAFTIKLVLQALSVIPFLGRFAFGLRPVIIGYLHLVTLGFLSFYLIGYFIQEKMLHSGPSGWKKGWGIFLTGVLLNETLLLLQALLAMYDRSLSFIPFLLLAVAAVIFSGLAIMLRDQRPTRLIFRSYRSDRTKPEG